MNIDLVAQLKDFDAFMQAYETGCEQCTYEGKSLLFYSLANNDPESRYQISSFLLDKGTDAAGTNAEGESVLHILLSRVKHNLKQTAELCARLIEAGANIEQLDNKGRSCLQYVVMSNFPEDDLVPLYDLLLVEGSKLPYTPNAWGKTPVDLAQAKGTRQEFLVRVGATP